MLLPIQAEQVPVLATLQVMGRKVKGFQNQALQTLGAQLLAE
jgi:hypothetical protein